MKRRDFVKAIGLGGLLPFVKTEAAPPPTVQPQTVEPKRYLYPGSESIYDSPIMGSAAWVTAGTGVYGPLIDWHSSPTYEYDFGGDE